MQVSYASTTMTSAAKMTLESLMKFGFMKFTLTLCVLFTSALQVRAQDVFTAAGSGNWTTPATWTVVRDVNNPGTSTYPGETAGSIDGADVVDVPSAAANLAVTLANVIPSPIGSITIVGSGTNGFTREIILNTGATLTVNGNVLIQGATPLNNNTTRIARLALNNGTLNVGGDLILRTNSTSAASTVRAQFVQAGGTVTVSGNLDLSQLGNTVRGTVSSTGGTFEFNGAANANIRNNSATAGSLNPVFANLLINKSSASITLPDEVGLTISAQSFTVNPSATFQANGTDATGVTHTLTVSGNLTNNGTLSLRNGATLDLVNVNLAGNLAGSGTSLFNNITFDGTANQLITIAGTVSNVQAVTYNNTGTAGSDEIRNQSVDFTNALTTRQTAAGITNISTFTNGNYIHDNTGTYIASGSGITLPAAADITALQGILRLADIETASVITNITGTLTVNGGTVDIGRNITATTGAIFDNVNLVTVTSGTLNIGAGFTNNTGTNRIDLAVGAASVFNQTGGTVNLFSSLLTSSAHPARISSGEMNISGGTMNICPVITAITAGNILQMNQINPRLNISGTGILNICAGIGFTNFAGTGSLLNLIGTSGTPAAVTLSGSGQLRVAPNLAFSPDLSVPGQGTLPVIDIEQAGASFTMTGGTLQCGGNNRGNFRLLGDDATFEMSGGVANITANLQLNGGGGNARTLLVSGGTLNVGTASSNGANSIVFNGDPGAPQVLRLDAGTINVGDGNSIITVGDNDNAPAFGSLNYAGLYINGGVFNMFGQFNLNDANARFVQTGGEFNINQGTQSPGGAADLLAFRRGIVYQQGGTIRLVDPNPTSGAGVTVLINNAGNPGTTAGVVSGDSLNPSVPITFLGTFSFGDGISTATGSPDGFDMLLSTNHTFASFEINNPSGTNRFVTLGLIGGPGTFPITGDMNVVAGEFRQGTNLVDVGNTLSVGALGTYRISNTSGSPFPSVGSATTLATGSTVIFDGLGNVTVTASGGTPFSNLVVAGDGFTKTINAARTVNDRLTIQSGILQTNPLLGAGTNRLTMATGSIVRIDSGAFAATLNHVIQGGNFYTVEYVGNSKSMANVEFSAAGPLKTLVANLNPGQTLTLNTNRNVRNLTIDTCFFNTNNFSLGVDSNITLNSGEHIGLGRIILQTSNVHTIAGNNSGILKALRITGPASTVNVNMTANTTIKDSISFATSTNDRFFNIIGNRVLTFDTLGTAIGISSATPRRFIVTDGTVGQGGVSKVFPGVGGPFVYPISGSNTKYTPAEITVNTGSPGGIVTIRPINSRIPFATGGTDSLLQYYWRVDRTGFTTNVNATLRFTYDQVDVSTPGVEDQYVPAIYNPAAFTTFSETQVDETTNIINFVGVNLIAGQYTAGHPNRFGTVEALYSVANGSWFNPNTWSLTPTGTPGNGGTPNNSKPIFIQGSRAVTLDANGAFAASVDITSTNDTLIIGDGTTGHDIGEISGFGTLRLVSNSTTPTFPTAIYATFLSEDGGTVEFGGTGSYTVPTSPGGIGEYRNLATSGSGVKTFAGENLFLYGSLRILGGTAQFNTGASGNITADSIFSIASGATLQYQGTGTARNIIAGRGVVNNGSFIVANSAILSHTLQIGGSLVNNGTLDLRNANTNCNVTFSGANNATISGTGLTTEFNFLNINKGADTSNVLQVTASNFSLPTTTTGNQALTLTNGTFRFSGTSATTIQLVTRVPAVDFVIPASARLWMDNPNAQFVITSASERKLILNGVIQVSQGQINIGTNNPPPDAQSRISYESTTAAIIVSGGELNVGESIIPSTGATLRYIQSGGTVRVSRYRSFTTASAAAQDLGLQTGDFVMSNSGGTFNMSGGALEVIRQNVGGTQFGIGLYIASGQTASVTGGEVRFITSETVNNRPMAFSSAVPFYNLVIGNGTYTGSVGNADAGATADVQVINDLTINTGSGGEFRLYRAGDATADNNNINLTVGGNINITGGSLLFGSAAGATTLFLSGTGAGTTQLITNTGSASSITLRSLTFNAVLDTVRLGTGGDLTIQNNFTLNTGVFDATTNGRRIIFATTANVNQNITIPSTGVTFYDLRVDKSTANNQVLVNNGNVTITNNLDLVNGVLNIQENGLNITSPIAGAITGGTFGTTRRIQLSGTVSAVGVTRAYPNTTTTGFAFPIGVGALYTPATINVTTADGSGTITVKPINTRFPSAPAASSLDYYWDVSVEGFGASVQTAHTYGYTGVTLAGAEANYRGNFFNGTTWAVTPQPLADDVDDANDVFGASVNAASVLNNVVGTFVSRAFTAGFNFANPVVFYSWAGGVIGGTMNWAPGTNNAATSPWSSDASVFNSAGVDGVEPTAANPVIIQNNHIVNITATGRTASSVSLNSGTTVNIGTTTGHNFGTGITGQGTLLTSTGTLPTLTSAFRNTGGGTVNFAGGTITITGPQTFNNLTVSAGTKTIGTGNLTINGNLAITGGTLNMATFTANRTSIGGTMSIAAGASLITQGTNGFPANYGTYSLAPTSTVQYNSNGNQTIASLGGQPYGNLEAFSTGGGPGTFTKTLAGATVVGGNLLVNRTGGTGNVTFATNNFNLTVEGNFTLNQTSPITEFLGGTSTVTFNGAGAQVITRVGGGTLTFNNLTVNKTAGSLTIATAAATTTLAIPGTLTLSSGALTIGGSVAVPNTLALNGTSTGAGTITGSANSNLTIGGTANTSAGTVNFTGGGQILRDLTVNRGTTSAAEVTLGTDLSVQNTLTFTNGRVIAGANTVTYNNTATGVTGGNNNSFVDGRLAIQFPTTGVTRNFPIGDTLSYRPVRITTASATAGSVVRAQMIDDPPTSGSLGGMNNISGIRYYSINLTAGSLTSPQVRLEYQPDEIVTDPNDLVVARSTDNNNWVNIGRDAANSSTSTPTGFITSNVTTIDPTTFFALGSLSADNPLPVNMLSLNTIAKNGRTAVIEWETASEQDNLGFVLYRSENENGNFEQIASYQTTDKLRGQGTKLTESKYVYEDSRNTMPGKEYFYKLTSIDLDGTRHDITLSGQSIWSVQLPFEYALDQNYPNPFNPVTTIQFSLEKAGRTTVEIYNVLGQKVATLVSGDLNAGAHRYQWNGSGMASGIYFYRLRSDNFVATKKMLLIK